jgi:hypothetical protein
MKSSKLLDRVEELTKENTLLAQALQDQVEGDVQWSHSGPYRVGATRLMGGLGGIVIIRWRCKGQRDTVNVLSLDDALANTALRARVGSDEALHLLKLLDQVRITRQKQIDALALAARGTDGDGVEAIDGEGQSMEVSK